MKTTSRLSSLLLIAVLAVATQSVGSLSETAHAGVTLATPAESIAPCHHHAGKMLPNSRSHSPRPLSYECCLTGHDVAVVRAAHFTQPSVQCSRVTLSDDMATTLTQLTHSELWMLVSPDPPDTTPLRL